MFNNDINYSTDNSEYDRYDQGKRTSKLEDKIGPMKKVMERKDWLLRWKNMRVPLFKRGRIYKMTSFDILHCGVQGEDKYKLVIHALPLYKKKK